MVKTGALNFLFVMQTFEWAIMLYMIRTQANRRLEEILYDHNHENPTEKRGKNQKTYRRNESLLGSCFLFFGIIYSLVVMAL